MRHDKFYGDRDRETIEEKKGGLRRVELVPYTFVLLCRSTNLKDVLLYDEANYCGACLS